MSGPWNEHALASDLPWVEVGRRCSAGRRSMWARVHPKPEAIRDDGSWYASAEDVECVELCAGREGGDASNPQFAEVLQLVLTAIYATET